MLCRSREVQGPLEDADGVLTSLFTSEATISKSGNGRIDPPGLQRPLLSPLHPLFDPAQTSAPPYPPPPPEQVMRSGAVRLLMRDDEEGVLEEQQRASTVAGVNTAILLSGYIVVSTDQG